MKTDLSISQLAIELERQAASRKDYIAPQGALVAEVVDNSVQIAGFNGDRFALTPHAHSQLATHLGIPQKYYDRMAGDQPDLLAQNVNTWFKADPANKRMIRALDGKVRAVLSDRYRPLDNMELAEAVLPILTGKAVQVVSASITETRMYIKVILPTLSDELPNGLAYGTGHANVGQDRGKVVSAVVISNSEVGNGSLRVEPSVFTTWCTNLAIMKEAQMRKYHVGRANATDEGGWEVFRNETREADDKAFFMKVRDVVTAAFDEQTFRARIAELRKTAEVAIEGELVQVVDMAVKQLALPERTGSPLLNLLAKGGDLTQWGLASAITRLGGDQENDYEFATQLERAGGELLALKGRALTQILAAKAA